MYHKFYHTLYTSYYDIIIKVPKMRWCSIEMKHEYIFSIHLAVFRWFFFYHSFASDFLSGVRHVEELEKPWWKCSAINSACSSSAGVSDGWCSCPVSLVLVFKTIYSDQLCSFTYMCTWLSIPSLYSTNFFLSDGLFFHYIFLVIKLSCHRLTEGCFLISNYQVISINWHLLWTQFYLYQILHSVMF